MKLDNAYCLVVVPLRLRSVRLPGKILKIIHGKTLAAQVLEKLLTELGSRTDVRVIAAIDDVSCEESLKKDFGDSLEVIMTDPALPSGTDRVFAAFLEFQKRNSHLPAPKGVINVQGDMPYLHAPALVPVVEYFLNATPANLVASSILTLSQDWPADCDFADIGQVKVISDRDRHALYFSRFQIPYSRVPFSEAKQEPEYPSYLPELHIGVYGYTPKALGEFCSHGPVALEKFEGLEQLRAQWLGKKILVLKCDVPDNRSFRGVDTAADFKWAVGFGSPTGKIRPTSRGKTPATKARAKKVKTKSSGNKPKASRKSKPVKGRSRK